MKTFLFDTFNKYKRLSESLDVEATLCNRPWCVFNNSGEKEVYIFQEKGKLLISLNGKVTHGTWEYIPANKSLIISGNDQSYMVHTAYVDNTLFALNIDGTNEFVFLIDENNKKKFQPQSYNDIKQYFQAKERIQIEKEESERIEQERKRLEYIRMTEQEKEEEKERKAEEIIRNKALEESKLYQITKKVGCIIWILFFIGPPAFSIYGVGIDILSALEISFIGCFLILPLCMFIIAVFMQEIIVERYKRKNKL